MSEQTFRKENNRIVDDTITDYVAKAAELRDRVTELEAELAKVSAERDMLHSFAASVRERDEQCATQSNSLGELQLENAKLKARICEDFLQMCRMSE